MENRPQRPANNRAAPQCDSKINSSKKMPKGRKYEGKCLEAPCSVCLPRSSCAAVINRSVGEFSLLFILSAGSFSTCSQLIHTRFVAALASGLETRNQLRKRQEKNEFYFRLRPKKILDWENEARVSSQNQETVCSKISRTSPRDSDRRNK